MNFNYFKIIIKFHTVSNHTYSTQPANSLSIPIFQFTSYDNIILPLYSLWYYINKIYYLVIRYGGKMKTILCYGDSNTYGAVPLDFDLFEKPFVSSLYRLPREKRWTGIFQSELGNDYYVIEEGLNGRTTVWDDPIEGTYKNGLKYLLPCLESHAPIDLVILMLGTNDLKIKFSVSALDIAMSIGVLVDTIQKSGFGPDGGKPKILILCPPPLGELSHLEDLFGKEGIKKSKDFAKYYKKVAKLYNCSFLDVATIIKSSDKDGVHYDEEDVKKLGKVLVKNVRDIIG